MNKEKVLFCERDENLISLRQLALVVCLKIEIHRNCSLDEATKILDFHGTYKNKKKYDATYKSLERDYCSGKTIPELIDKHQHKRRGCGALAAVCVTILLYGTLT